MEYGLINYARFCDNVDYVFTDACQPQAVIDNSKSTSNFTDDEKDKFIAMLSAIKTEIINKRVMIKPQFQDYDRTNSCHVTAE